MCPMRLAKALSLLIAATVLFAIAMRSPLWNFDSIGYAGLARHWLGQPDQEVHDGVYRDLERAAPSKLSKDIAAVSEYRRSLASDPVLFAGQLPFYANKPLYVLLIIGVSKSGIDTLRAGFLVSAAAYALLGVTVILWCTATLGWRGGWIFAACLVLSPLVRELGQIATPDALSTALMVAGLYSVVAGQVWKWSAFLWLLSILCRPDQLFLVIALLTWSRSSFPNRRSVTLIVMSAIVAAVISARLTGAYSWSQVFVHTFVRRLTTVEDLKSSSLGMTEYFVAVRRGIEGEFVSHPSVILLFAAASVACRLAATLLRTPRQTQLLQLQTALWIGIAIHFVMFPMLADRFFVGQYLGIAITSASVAWLGRTGEQTDW
jgi:hypothetical protein